MFDRTDFRSQLSPIISETIVESQFRAKVMDIRLESLLWPNV